MFRLIKKQKEIKKTAGTGIEKKEQLNDDELKERIHVMPQRFHVTPKKKKSSWLVVIIVIGVLLISGLAAAAIYLNYSLNQTEQEPVAPPVLPDNNNQNPVNQNQNQNQNVNQNINTNTSTTTTNINVNINTNTNTNSATSTNTNVNTNVNTNTNTSVIRPLPLALDEDNDNLTSAEESLFGTDPKISDSDGDTYSDGSELLNGYDPTKPDATLADSNLFSTYSHSLYSIVYPEGWLVSEQDDEKMEVLFIADSGEFVEVLVVPNARNLTLRAWYQDQFPQVSLSLTTSVKINNLSGLRHPDNRSYYLMKDNDQSRVFILTYNVGNLTVTNFMTTFQIMAKSFLTF